MSPARPGWQTSVSLLIAGAGIMGLWAAEMAARAGIDALVVDGAGPGRGASGGLLGALMPHMPDKWSDKKAFQFEALLALEAEAERVEAESGVAVGYRRCGRMMPLPKPHLRVIAERHQQDAAQNWRAGDRRFFWHVLDKAPSAGWPDASFCDAGLVHDTLAARLSPRGLTQALSTLIGRRRGGIACLAADIVSIDPLRRAVRLSDGGSIAFDHLIVAAGHRSFPLIERLGPPLPVPLGQPVKGQAALLAGDVAGDQPVIFLDGLYIVPHGRGSVAVGSTSEDRFDDALATDGALDALIAKARMVAPLLADCSVVERWAGLRPKAAERDPMVGPHPQYPHILALTGGFKVSFGLAHRLAERLIASLCGDALSVPRSFTLASHLAENARKG